MKAMSLVSIIIPCYNHADYVRDCIRSILCQNYSPIEVLICDDCSTDESWNILGELKRELDNACLRSVIIRNNVNIGITKTLNKLLSLSNGDFIKLLASDDMLRGENAISEYVEYFEKNEVQVVIGNGRVVDEFQHHPVQEEGRTIYENAPDLEGSGLFERIYKDNYIFAPGMMVKKEIYNKVGNYNEDLMTEDWELWLRLSLKQKVKFGYLDKELIYYRRNSNSMTSLVKNEGMEKRRFILHVSEMKIIDMYGGELQRSVYADKKISTILRERAIAREQQLGELYGYTTQELKNFRMWRFLGIRRIASILKNEVLTRNEK